jgi:D-alanyl-D-alanine endopeptidase (penicillin-binding protein 7)
MASENRAANALGRTHPGGSAAFIRAMNAKASSLGMYNSSFADPAGLDEANVASPSDLARMILAASRYPLIAEATTLRKLEVRPWSRRGPVRFGNTNRLLRNKHWDINLSKTGYINEAGRCLVMLTEVEGTPMTMVFLNSYGKLTPFGDANRTRKWLKNGILRSASNTR